MNDILYFVTKAVLIVFVLLIIYIIKTPENDASDEWDNW